MGWEDRHKAYMTLRAVLHSLRDRSLGRPRFGAVA